MAAIMCGSALYMSATGATVRVYTSPYDGIQPPYEQPVVLARIGARHQNGVGRCDPPWIYGSVHSGFRTPCV